MKNRLLFVLEKIFIAFFALAAVIAIVSQAHAQTACMDAQTLNDRLVKTEHQTDVGGGRLTPKTILRLYASEDGKTFSVIIVNINGMACLMATGDGFDLTKPKSSTETEG